MNIRTIFRLGASLLVPALLILPAAVTAKKVTIRHQAPKSKKQNRTNGRREIALNQRDTLLSDTLFSRVRFSGYDKTVNANKESIFVTNGSSVYLKGIKIEINYKSMQGKQYDRRTREIYLDLPPGETRKADFTTWDAQGSFFYYLSEPPKRKSAIPYTVEVKLKSVTPLLRE